MAKITNYCRSIFFVSLLLIIALLALLLTAPLASFNRFLPDGITLLNPRGNLSKGEWENMLIQGKTYPLSCRYHRQGFFITGMTYVISCDSPVRVVSQLRVGLTGNVRIENMRMTGDIAAAQDWLEWLNVPGQFSGDIDLKVKKAEIRQQTLMYLDLSGSAQNIRFFYVPIFPHLAIETRNKALSIKPIELEIRTMTANQDKNPVNLYVVSEIDGKNYQTHGEISGEVLENYAQILRFFGRQIGRGRFQIQLQGHLF